MPQEKTIRKNLPVSEADPRPGCLMFSVGGLVILTLATWAIYTFFAQRKALVAMSDDRPAELVLPAEAADAAAAQAANDKLAAAAADENAGSVTLEGRECIAAFAASPYTAELKKSVTLTAVDSQFHFQCAITLHHVDGRHLNCRIAAEPIVTPDDGLTLRSTKIEVPGREIPAQFAEVYHDQGAFRQLVMPAAQNDKAAGTFLRRVTKADLANGRLEISYKAKAKG